MIIMIVWHRYCANDIIFRASFHQWWRITKLRDGFDRMISIFWTVSRNVRRFQGIHINFIKWTFDHVSVYEAITQELRFHMSFTYDFPMVWQILIFVVTIYWSRHPLWIYDFLYLYIYLYVCIFSYRYCRSFEGVIATDSESNRIHYASDYYHQVTDLHKKEL